MIERVAVIKHGAMLTELRSVLGGESNSEAVMFDSVIPYVRDLIDGFGDRKVLFIGRSDRDESGRIGEHIALSVNTDMSEGTPLPIKIIKRRAADRRIKRALRDFDPQLILSFGFYNDQELFHRFALENGAVYVPVIAAPWIEPRGAIRRYLWKKGTEALTDPRNKAIFVRGEYLRDHMAEEFDIPLEKIHVYWPQYPKAFYSSPTPDPFDSDRFNLLYVGRFSGEKGVKLLPDVLRYVLQKLPKTKLSLVGAGPLEGWLRDALSAIGPEGEAWEVLGFVPPRSIARYFAHCDVLIVPSFVEGFGKVVYEGMLCGAPIVASNVHNIPRLVRDGVDGRLVEPGDSTAFAEAVLDIARMPDFKRRIRSVERTVPEGKLSLGELLKRFIEDIERDGIDHVKKN